MDYNFNPNDFDNEPFDFVMALQVNLIEQTILNNNKKGSIYLGDINSIQNKCFLKNKNISHVLSLVNKEKDAYEFEIIKKLELNHLLIAADDSPDYDLKQNFHKTSDFINKSHKNGNILIHCYAGVSRSTSCLMAYYIKYQNMNTENALTFIKAKRSVVFPNNGFIQQLKIFEEQVKNEEKLETTEK